MTPVTHNQGKDDAVGTHKIRTTINPGEVLTVDDAGKLDAERLGILLDEKSSKKLNEAAAPAAADDKKKGA